MKNPFTRPVAGPLLLLAASLATLAIVALAVGLATVRAHTSGPSASGYVWVDNNAPDPVITFDWVDATGGTAVVNFVDDQGSPNDDDGTVTLPLPFTFSFFGTDYTELDIGTNGLLSFDIGNACNRQYNWNHFPIPHDDADCIADGWGGNPLIASWFDDLNPGECGDIYYDTIGSAPNRRFVVQFHDVCHFHSQPGEGVTFETILFEGSSDIKVQYLDAFFGTGTSDIQEGNYGGTATTGISLDGSAGLQYSYNAPALTDGLAVLFTTQQPTASRTPTPTSTPAAVPTPTPTASPTPMATPTPTVLPAIAAPEPSLGYWLAASDGGTFAFGDALFFGSTGAISLNQPVVGMAATPSGNGYWLVASDGGIFTFGDAAFHGSTGNIPLNQPIVSMAATPTGNGYWLVASDGGIFTYGDAAFHGSTGAIALNQPIVGMAATPSGNGYWLEASDGGIFTYGDAGFFGSTGDIPINAPIVGMAATPTGNGYWLVASDGGIFAFGDAGFHGSTGNIPLNQPIVGMAATLSGNGYWLVASDGGIFTYGDVGFFGSTGNIPLNQPIVGMAATPSGNGYWLVASDGGIFSAAAPEPGGTIWRPALNTSWQWQLTGTLDTSVDVEMYDIDLFDNDASVVASLHAQGRRVVCYISAGSWEDWRPDADQFPGSVKGRSNGWPGERWLDIRRLDILGPIMEARMDLCAQKGFDGVEFDNVDGYSGNTGFPLTYQDQLTYNRWLAGAAHARGLSVGLKNDVEQVVDLLPFFDWALSEECFSYNECNALLPFIQAGKAVFVVEYDLSTSQFCPQANAMNFNAMRKHLDLDAYREPCR